MKPHIRKQTPPLSHQRDGTIRLTGSRITLDTIVGMFQKGGTAEQIQDSFPSLSLRQIYGVIAYYLEHQDEVEAYLKSRKQGALKLRHEIESQQDTTGFRERIRVRRAKVVKS